MKIVTCQSCNQRYRVNEEKITGQPEFQCQKCFNMVQVPMAESEPEVAALPEYVDEYDPNVTQQPESEPAPQVDVVPAVVTNTQFGASQSADKTIGWKDSIRTKIGSILVAVTAIILSGYIIFNYNTNKTKLTDELNNFAEIASIRLSKSMVGPLWEVDGAQVEDAINSEMLDKRIYAILVRDNDLKTVFQGGKRNSNWDFIPTKANVSGDFIRKQREIKWGKELIGSVEVYVTDRFMIEESRNSAMSMATTAVVLIIVILGAVFVTLRRFMILPITKLTNAAEQMSLGDLNVDLGVQSNDEIGVLAQAIERMQTSLGLALNRLRRTR